MMTWAERGERASSMELSEGGADWIDVSRGDPASDAWRVEGRIDGRHYKLEEAFPTKQVAQGCALLLAMRLFPRCRDAAHAQLAALPGTWWWKLAPLDGAGAADGPIFSSRVSESLEAAERSGRAAGRGRCLFVYGPGTVRAFGELPR